VICEKVSKMGHSTQIKVTSPTFFVWRKTNNQLGSNSSLHQDFFSKTFFQPSIAQNAHSVLAHEEVFVPPQQALRGRPQVGPVPQVWPRPQPSQPLWLAQAQAPSPQAVSQPLRFSQAPVQVAQPQPQAQTFP
jgi:hypothetical protein